VEKAQAIRLEACIPQNWWEFAVNYAVDIYNQTPLKRSSNDYKMLFERLHHTKPDVAHLRVFGCGAYVFLPEDVRSNNLSPRSELMTFIGLVEGTKGYIFMRSPNNVVFTAIQALFDKTLFPKCPNMRRLGYTPVGLPPDDLQGEHNGPLDNENCYEQLLLFFSSSLTCDCHMLFILLILTRLYLQEYTVTKHMYNMCLPHGKHTFSSCLPHV
jgi:hypothetical protein